MNQRNIIISILVLIIPVILFSCGGNENKTLSDSNDQKDQVHILRFERELFKSDTRNIDTTLIHLKQKYGEFYTLYFSGIMSLGSTESPNFPFIIKDFISNKDFKLLAKDCDSIYADMSKYEKQISDVYTIYKKEFPEDTLPQPVSFISGFNNGIVTTDGYIGIGLDLFLGEDYKFYPSLDFPQFMIRRYTPEHLMPTFVKGLALSKYDEETKNPTLLDQMIKEGKMLYFMDIMLPGVHDSLKIGYTKSQLSWATKNEANIYQLLIEENLFSKEYLAYKKYTDEAPFTSSLSNDSAPRIGWYCGWQIIKSYMKKNSHITLDQLMNEKDSQKILNLSKYKP